MNKQKLNWSLGFSLILLSSLVGTPIKAHAGLAVVKGTSVDSSSYSAGTFNPVNSAIILSPAPSTSVEITAGEVQIPPDSTTPTGQDKGQGQIPKLSISQVGQNNLNQVAASIVSQPPNPNSPVIALVQGRSDVNVAQNQIRSIFINLGVNTISVEKTLKYILDLIATLRSSPSVNVDVNQVNLAINAFNQLVQTSNGEVLQQLAKNSEFQEINQILKQLRQSLNVNSQK